MELFNALGFSAVCLALAFILVASTPRQARAFWLRVGVAGALVLCAIALPVGLVFLP